MSAADALMVLQVGAVALLVVGSALVWRVLKLTDSHTDTGTGGPQTPDVGRLAEPEETIRRAA